MQEAAISDAMAAARIFLTDTAERRAYINREMARMDHEAWMEEAREDGLEQGLEQGIEQGVRAMVISMIQNGLDDATIAKIANMPVEEVKKERGGK